MTNILFLADLHLAAKGPTPQHLALEALSQLIQQQRPQLVVSLGDLTLCGEPASGQAFRQALGPAPFLGTLGNSDLRSPSQLPVLERLLEPDCCWQGEGCRLLLLRLRQGRLLEESRRQLLSAAKGTETLVLGAHHPPEDWEPESRGLLEACISQRPALFLCGHLHRFFSRKMGQGRLVSLGALDPDKSIGGPCQGAVLTLEQGKEPVVSPIPLPLEEKDFTPFLGLSAAAPEQILLAAQQYLPALELRPECFALPGSPPLQELSQWRQAGGRCLSLHLPDVLWKNGILEGEERLGSFAALCRQLGAQQATLHPPKGISAGRLSLVCGALSKALAPLSPQVLIAVENLHAVPGQQGHPFGALPEECRLFLAALEQCLPNPIGYRLDLGHARNNPGIYSQYSLGVWMRELGPRCAGYHLHQVASLADGKMENHQPFSQFYGELISLGGLSAAFASGLLPVGPLPQGGFASVLLEQRRGEGYPQSLMTLKEHFGDENRHGTPKKLP